MRLTQATKSFLDYHRMNSFISSREPGRISKSFDALIASYRSVKTGSFKFSGVIFL